MCVRHYSAFMITLTLSAVIFFHTAFRKVLSRCSVPSDEGFAVSVGDKLHVRLPGVFGGLESSGDVCCIVCPSITLVISKGQ